jgi:hypothetical protein
MIYNWFTSLQKRYKEGTDFTFAEGEAKLYENLNWVIESKPSLEEFQEMAEKDTAAAMLERVRAERNKLISETDWKFRSDLNPSQDWIDYCQALRDITDDSSNWSWNANGDLTINWPTKPK